MEAPLPDCLLPASAAAGAVPILAVAPDGLAAAGGSFDLRTADWIAATGFKADAGATLLLPDAAGNLAGVLFGLGDPKSADRTPLIAGKLATALPPGNYRLGHGFDDPTLASLAFALGAYRFSRYRREPAKGPRLVLSGDVDAAAIAAIADGVYLARDLINVPANDLGPAELADAANDFAHGHDARLTIIEASALREMNFPLILAVGAGASAARQPRLIDLTWGDPSHPKVTLVGKGVCFDSGGLDIKTSAGMLLMKKDMAGAAHALGFAHMVIATGVKVRLRVLVPAVENAISGESFRPGDVFKSRKGLTVEIGNTDAEGRLILADALAYASEEKPDLLVDLATLTGSARVAVGPDIVPCYTNDDALFAELAAASVAVGDPVWRMPLWAPYQSLLDSRVADLNSVSSSPYAGSIIGALFLSRFVPPEIAWMHADIFGWNPSSRPGRPEGGEAQLIRALIALVTKRYGRA
jgi:leucyl aminopeptidase